MLTTQELERKLQIVKELEQLSNQLVYECRKIGRIPRISIEFGYHAFLQFDGSDGFVVATSASTQKIENFSYRDFCEAVKKLPNFVYRFREAIQHEEKRIISLSNEMHGDILSMLTPEAKSGTSIGSTKPYR